MPPVTNNNNTVPGNNSANGGSSQQNGNSSRRQPDLQKVAERVYQLMLEDARRERERMGRR